VEPVSSVPSAATPQGALEEIKYQFIQRRVMESLLIYADWDEWAKKLNGWRQGVLLGVPFALVFWLYSESTLPVGENCAWLASPETDLLAFLGAAICVWRAREYNDFWVAAFGACVIVIHACQFAVAKSLF